MKIVNVKQNTNEWKEWRGKGIGASDAPTIMGESPWSTILELWLDKTGLFPKSEPNAYAVVAMRRGTELEPSARILFEQHIGNSYPSLSAEHDKFPFIRASFDGYNEELNEILEIKCPGKGDHAKALRGNIPSKYVAQLQQQLLVSGANVCNYFSWDGVESTAHILVYPDYEYQAELLGELISFYDCVTKRILPSVAKSDIIKIVGTLQKKLEDMQNLVTVLRILSDGIVPEEMNKPTKKRMINVR